MTRRDQPAPPVNAPEQDLYASLLAKIQQRRAQVGIIGLGYVGLPLARAFALGGYPVLGFDVDPVKIEKLARGQSYIGHLGEPVVREMAAKGFRATADFGRLGEPDAVIICVPTPLTETREPDLSYIVKSAQAIAARLRRGQLVVLESTTYPGTTRDVVQPILEARGLKAGTDFFLAFSPEREDPGNPSFSAPTIPKVVGGLEPRSLELAATLYGQVVVKVVRVSSPEVAEACKILENTYRGINIALINELKVLYDRMGIDVWEVIEAARTKPFGFQAFYPGPGLGGHCLDGAEVVCVRDGDGAHVVRFAELFERWAGRSRRRPDGVEVAEVEGLEALSLDTDTGETRFAPVTHLFRRSAPSPLLRLRVRGNRQLTVTDGHPMLVHNGVAIEERRADEILPGDRLVLSTDWPDEAPRDETIDLIDVAVRHGLERVRVQPRQGRWQDDDAVVRAALKGTPTAAKDVYRHNTLPLEDYLRLEVEGTVPFRREEVWLATGKGRSWNRVPAVMAINEDFARLIGYYLSEGCITDDGALRTRFAFGSHEGDLIAEASAILRRLGLQHSLHRLRSCATVQIKVSSRLLAVLLRDELGCGVRSEDARIPSRLLGAPASIRRALLAGLLRGDGDVDFRSKPRAYRKRDRQYRHRLHAATVGYFTSSPVLFQQATLLMQGLGYVPTFHRTKPHIRLAGQQIEGLEPLLCGAKRANLKGYREGRVRTVAPRSYVSHGAFATVEVLGAEPAEGTAVYSMEVAGTHTFITSYGIAVHNCIPIDPFYLTWVARKYGLATRFIELAGEINTSMPAFVVGKVADSLNDRGKPVKGSKVALLGMAYKKDVDDPRESPGFELMELLLKKGAVVSYNDPHIPRLPRMRHYPDLQMDSQPLTAEYLQAQDCVLIATDHSAYDWQWIVENSSLVVDTRNATRNVTAHRQRIVKA
jgi:UDP-N-acetyl-D-mannosaminuronate dehydrogenase/intein/homing endonuclease